MVSGRQAEHLEDRGVSRRLQRVPIVGGSLVQLTFENGSELMLYRWEFQVVGVKSFRDFLSLRSSHGLNMQLCLGNYETMVCPTVRAAHCLGHSQVLPVLSPDDDIVNEVPVLGAKVHPRRLVAGREMEHGVGNAHMCGKHLV
mgnify:FL=1